MTIILILTSLVVFNFLLLFFSCNKTTKMEMKEVKPIKQRPTVVASQLETHLLAPTGS